MQTLNHLCSRLHDTVIMGGKGPFTVIQNSGANEYIIDVPDILAGWPAGRLRTVLFFLVLFPYNSNSTDKFWVHGLSSVSLGKHVHVHDKFLSHITIAHFTCTVLIGCLVTRP